MRIVQINGGAKGSTGKIMMGIAEVARAQGHEVMCASPITTTNRDAGEDCGYYRIGTFNSRRLNVALARIDRKSTRLNSSHLDGSRMPSSA